MTKNLSYISFLLLFCLSANEAFASSKYQLERDTLDSEVKVEMTFEAPHQSFGKIKRGDKRETTFKFVNTGNQDIIIELVSSCECTTVDWPRRPIKPGSTGQIDVIFDSTEKEKSETVDIDIHLKNTDPRTGYPILEIVSYSFEFID